MKLPLGFLFLATMLPLTMGCDNSSPPTAPAPHVDSIPGFVPLAVGNTWKYSYSYSWGNGHNGDASVDSGFRRITIASRADSAGMTLYHAQIDDSIARQFSWNGMPMGGPQLSVTTRTIGLLEGSFRIQLAPGAKDDDGMLAVCFRSHAFPADSVHKIPGNAYGAPGLPDTVFMARITEAPEMSILVKSEQAQGVGQLGYSVNNQGSFNANGSITPVSRLEYRLVEFRLSP